MQLTGRGRQAAAFARAQPLYWREAALCVPAIPCLLLLGFASHRLADGAVAAGAAFAVGFGAARDLRGRRWAAMIAAGVGTSIAAFLGCLAGQRTETLLAAAMLAAATCAVLALIDEDLWWISLQMVIALLVGEYFAGAAGAALERAAAVLAGGAVQVACVVILARLAPAAAGPLPAGPPKPPPTRGLLLAHAVRAACSVALSLEIARTVGLANSYWAPMTAMLVLKPGLGDTHARGIARLAGTVAGGLAAAAFAAGVGYDRLPLVLAVGFGAGASFALQKAHYALLTTAVTATVVLLLSLARGGGALGNAEHRLVATALGGAIALAVAAIAPHRPHAGPVPGDVVGG